MATGRGSWGAATVACAMTFGMACSVSTRDESDDARLGVESETLDASDVASIIGTLVWALGDVDGDAYPNFVDPDSDNDAICDPGIARAIPCARAGLTNGFCCTVIAGGDDCPLARNFTQLDTDGDGLGDACDPCTDADDDAYGRTGTYDNDGAMVAVGPAVHHYLPQSAADRARLGVYGTDACAGADCADEDASRHPGAAEVCDGVDQDCFGGADERVDASGALTGIDPDGDGYNACGSWNGNGPVAAPSASLVDCNEGSVIAHPGANEVCNGVDDDCSCPYGADGNPASWAGLLSTGFVDANGAPARCIDETFDTDSDGYAACATPRDTAGRTCVDDDGAPASCTDCDDAIAKAHPRIASEPTRERTSLGGTCSNQIDDDCDGAVDWADSACTVGTPAAIDPSWYRGAFRNVPLSTAAACASGCTAGAEQDLATIIGKQTLHTVGYAIPDAPELARVTVMMNAIASATRASLADPNAGDWCGAVHAARAAGYALTRIYDVASHRWYLQGIADFSTSSPLPVASGGAHFWINPEPRRNVIVEAPHVGFDTNTRTEAGPVFLALGARAAVLNAISRCYAPSGASPCAGTTQACSQATPKVDEPFLESDQAHSIHSTFNAIHEAFDALTFPNFVQLHTMASATPELAIVSDGTDVEGDAHGAETVSDRFVQRLMADPRVPSSIVPAASCQGGPDPSRELCATTSVQARYTNGLRGDANGDGIADMCKGPPVSTYLDGGRFLHIEQQGNLAAAAGTAGVIGEGRDMVIGALVATWPDCAHGSCALAPQDGAAAVPTLACP